MHNSSVSACGPNVQQGESVTVLTTTDKSAAACAHTCCTIVSKPDNCMPKYVVPKGQLVILMVGRPNNDLHLFSICNSAEQMQDNQNSERHCAEQHIETLTSEVS